MELSIKILALLLIVLATAMEVAGDVFFKKWSLGGKNIILIAGFLIYAVGTIFWAFSLKYEPLSKAISILSLLNLIAVTLIGIFYFKEDLSIINKMGIMLGIISIVLIEL